MEQKILHPTEELKKLYYDAARDFFFGAVKPAMAIDEEKHPMMIGSAILLEIDAEKYLVTAAHVIDQATQGIIFIPNDDKLYPIEINGFSTLAPDNDRRKDRYDFACCHLSEEQLKNLVNATFINEGHIASGEDGSANQFMAMGYPKTKNKVNIAAEKIDGKLYTYIDKGLRKETDFSYLEYKNTLKDKEKMIFDKPIDPDGMSGGALIDLGPYDWEKIIERTEKKLPSGKLIGLIIEKHRREEDSRRIEEIKAVDIAFIVSEIKKRSIKKQGD